jgi:hypothetical protein
MENMAKGAEWQIKKGWKMRYPHEINPRYQRFQSKPNPTSRLRGVQGRLSSRTLPRYGRRIQARYARSLLRMPSGASPWVYRELTLSNVVLEWDSSDGCICELLLKQAYDFKELPWGGVKLGKRTKVEESDKAPPPKKARASWE